MGTGRRGLSEELVIDAQSSSWNSFVSQRRTVLQLGCGVFFFSLLAACASSDNTDQTTPSVLTIAVPEGRLDTAESGIRQPAEYLSHEGLTIINPEGRAQPGLARSWTWANDGRQLRLTLKNDVRTHDGSTLTAAVVADALRGAVSRPGNRLLYPSFANVTRVDASGDSELVIDLSRPAAFLPEELALRLSFGPQNLGTGAFRIVRSAVDAIELDRFDDYHGGRAHISQVVFKAFPTLRVAWTSLLRGEVDMVSNVPPDALEFMSNDVVDVLSFARPYQFMLAFNSRRSPLSIPAVRRALNFAVDRDALVARALKGNAAPSTGPLPHQHWAYDSSILGYTFDPVQAAAALDAAGFPLRDGRSGERERFTLVCLIPANFSLVERVALEVQRNLYVIGVNVKFESVPIQEFDTRVREGRFEAVLIDMVSGPGINRSQMFWRSAQTVQGLNVFGYENPEVERLYTVLSESTNEAAIRSATARLQRAFLDDPPALFIAWTQGSRAVSRQFNVIQEPGRDPLYGIWRWTPRATEFAAQLN